MGIIHIGVKRRATSAAITVGPRSTKLKTWIDTAMVSMADLILFFVMLWNQMNENALESLLRNRERERKKNRERNRKK